MAKYLSTLRKDAGKLRNLLLDVKDAKLLSKAWDSEVRCARTLGSGVHVEQWYLAECFLTTWKDWESRFFRYLRYFGQSPEVIPNTWRELKGTCESLTTYLWASAELDEKIAGSWRSRYERQEESLEPSQREVCGLYHEIVASHHRMAICPSITSESGPWQLSGAAAATIDRRIRNLFDDVSVPVRRQLRRHLRQYRHNMLDLSWLDEQRWQSCPSAFEYALGKAVEHPIWLNGLRADWQHNVSASEEAGHVLVRLLRAIHEIGYKSFRAEVLSDEMLGGPATPIGSNAVHLIGKDSPSSIDGLTHILVALATGLGKRSSASLPEVLERMLAVLAERPAWPAIAFMVCDAWNSDDFSTTYFTRFQECYDQGHRFVFLLVGTEDTEVAPISVSLGPDESFHPVYLERNGD